MRSLAARPPPQDILGIFPNLEVLFSVGAGVDLFNFARLRPGLPVVRIIEPGLEAAMPDYVTFAVHGADGAAQHAVGTAGSSPALPKIR